MGQYGPPTPPHKPPISKQQQKNREQGIRATEAQSAKEYQRRNAERIRKLKMNPDGTPKNTGANEK